MAEVYGGNLLRHSGDLAWFEPVEPLGGIGHVAMTTRAGGLSVEPYESLNLGFHVGDVEERVRLNRLSVAGAACPLRDRRLLEPVVGEQIHGSHVRVVGELHAGTRWQSHEKALSGTDALVTASARLPLMTLVADCLPIALVDPARTVAAAVHAGWRGLVGGVVENTLSLMKRTWGTVPADLVAWIGPGIGPCCYEVGPEVAEHFPQASASAPPLSAEKGSQAWHPGEPGYVDLRLAVRHRLTGAGLLEENVTGLDLCTACRDELFFSHRRATREGFSTTGRQAMLLWMDSPSS